jgi:hypothetical protein
MWFMPQTSTGVYPQSLVMVWREWNPDIEGEGLGGVITLDWIWSLEYSLHDWILVAL